MEVTSVENVNFGLIKTMKTRNTLKYKNRSKKVKGRKKLKLLTNVKGGENE